MEIAVFDTDFLFEYFQRNQDAVAFVDEGKFVAATSIVCVMEMVKSCKNKDVQHKLTEKHLPGILVIPVEREISEECLRLIKQYHLSHNLSLNDAFIAATALHFNLPLATCNTADFQYIPGLVLVKHNVKPKRRGGSLFTL